MLGILCYLCGLFHSMIFPQESRDVNLFGVVFLAVGFEMAIFFLKEKRWICYLIPVGFFLGLIRYDAVKPLVCEEISFEDFTEANVSGTVHWVEQKQETVRITLSDVQVQLLESEALEPEAPEPEPLEPEASEPEPPEPEASEPEPPEPEAPGSEPPVTEFTCQGVIVSMPVSSNEIFPGVRLFVKGSFYHFKETSNPGEFDLKQYYRTKQLSYGLYVDVAEGNFSILPEQSKGKSGRFCFLTNRWSEMEKQGLKVLWRLRQKLSDSLERIAPKEEAGILKAMLLGDDGDLSEEVRTLYQEMGISHLLCISGLHISMIGLAVWTIFRYLLPSAPLAAGFSGLTVFCYGKMTGMGTAAGRAVMMYFLMIIAWNIGRTYDMATALGIAAAVLLTQNPLLIQNTGFLLSFVAVLGILFASSMVEKREKKQNFIYSFAIYLMTLPILLSFYYQLSPYSMILNLLILPTSSYLLGFGILGCLAGIKSVFLGKILVFPAVKLLWLYQEIMQACQHFPGAVLVLGKPKISRIAGYYIGLFCLWAWWKRKGRLNDGKEQT